MSEMIDRVEAAIKQLCGWGCVYPDTCKCRKAARAAIEAMREPTEEMVRHAYDECATTDLAGRKDFIAHYSDVWDSMIDAALQSASNQSPTFEKA